jgi:hypothetical protein
MAHWLALASEGEMAARASTIAAGLSEGEPADSRFVRRLIELGLDVAFINLHPKNQI